MRVPVKREHRVWPMRGRRLTTRSGGKWVGAGKPGLAWARREHVRTCLGGVSGRGAVVESGRWGRSMGTSHPCAGDRALGWSWAALEMGGLVGGRHIGCGMGGEVCGRFVSGRERADGLTCAREPLLIPIECGVRKRSPCICTVTMYVCVGRVIHPYTCQMAFLHILSVCGPGRKFPTLI